MGMGETGKKRGTHNEGDHGVSDRPSGQKESLIVIHST